MHPKVLSASCWDVDICGHSLVSRDEGFLGIEVVDLVDD